MCPDVVERRSDAEDAMGTDPTPKTFEELRPLVVFVGQCGIAAYGVAFIFVDTLSGRDSSSPPVDYDGLVT